MQGIDTIFYVIVLIMSVVIHEVAHGFAAESQGDPTARYAGRLTLNPLRHIDIVGSVILPLLLIVMSAGFVIGWAKPVPYNVRNLRNKKWGTAIVAGAGIVANLSIALVFGIAARLLPIASAVKQSVVVGFLSGNHDLMAQGFMAGPLAKVFFIFAMIVFVNLLLALFNLIPLPPLDGSKILFSLLPSSRFAAVQQKVEYFSLPLLILFIIFLWPHIVPVIGYIFTAITGTPLSLA